VQKHEKRENNIKVDIQEIGLKAWIGLIRLRIGESNLKCFDKLENFYFLKKNLLLKLDN